MRLKNAKNINKLVAIVMPNGIDGNKSKHSTYDERSLFMK